MVIEIQHKQAAQGRFFIHHSLYKEPILLFFFFFSTFIPMCHSRFMKYTRRFCSAIYLYNIFCFVFGEGNCNNSVEPHHKSTRPTTQLNNYFQLNATIRMRSLPSVFLLLVACATELSSVFVCLLLSERFRFKFGQRLVTIAIWPCPWTASSHTPFTRYGTERTCALHKLARWTIALYVHSVNEQHTQSNIYWCIGGLREFVCVCVSGWFQVAAVPQIFNQNCNYEFVFLFFTFV